VFVDVLVVDTPVAVLASDHRRTFTFGTSAGLNHPAASSSYSSREMITIRFPWQVTVQTSQ
jgi:hypothetical protein